MFSIIDLFSLSLRLWLLKKYKTRKYKILKYSFTHDLYYPLPSMQCNVTRCENIVSWSQTSNIIHRLFVICPLLTKKKKEKKSIIPVHYNNDNNDNNNNNNKNNN